MTSRYRPIRPLVVAIAVGCILPLTIWRTGPIDRFWWSLGGVAAPIAIAMGWFLIPAVARSFNRSWLQFRISTLLMLTALCALTLSALLPDWNSKREQIRFLQALEATGAKVNVATSGDIITVHEVCYVDLYRTSMNDADLEQLSRFPGAKTVLHLDLRQTRITNAGLKHLHRFSSLTQLYLDQSAITDDGLVHLHGLARLREVWLFNTRVTPNGVGRLQRAIPLANVGANYWYLTDDRSESRSEKGNGSN